MFKKKHRLTAREFSEFFAMGKRLHLPTIQLTYMPFAEKKVAVVIPKKIYKRAVDRNRLRRQIYYALRTVVPESGVFLFILKKEAKNTDISAIIADAITLVGRTQKTR